MLNAQSPNNTFYINTLYPTYESETKLNIYRLPHRKPSPENPDSWKYCQKETHH